MKIYHWESEFMADWSKGHIIVLARNPDHARAVARTAVKSAYPDFVEDDLAPFEADIAKEPKVEAVGLFIHGSA